MGLCCPEHHTCLQIITEPYSDVSTEIGVEVDLLLDNNNCGACGIVCGFTQTCRNGSCVAAY
jgi:hypothetical protein